MNKKTFPTTIIALAASIIWLSASTSQAKGNAAAGAKKSATCVACHGAKGISANDLWPNLAGQKAGYLVKQMKDFKSKTRKDPVMGAQAMLIKDADIADIAAYFASLKK